MTESEKEEAGIRSLPTNLSDALDALMRDEVLVEALGHHVLLHFIEAKRIEWNMFRTQVTEWEREQYLTLY
ncbi:hypothetical protein GCM10025858_00510 [Alicyclobacillus sacchari]|nr:hypothetical protein GCM10025858_00510 [Alicyclobacillus sacchari]